MPPRKTMQADARATAMNEEGRGGLRLTIEKHLTDMRRAGVPILWYHTYRSDRSPAGFPDYVIVCRPKTGPGAVIVRELKSSTGRVTPAQQEWLDGLRQAGMDADVWRPEDWFSGRIARELSTLCAAQAVAA